ncbi:protein LTV1 homolog [Paramacrobiotus metropolitanus]|uniref:protein LTV1 homolog n=1 Tax=Paramacrobiotus metropolitanus TaxID=2943436 RepID=UPI00244637DF|nr:protein LTV1 homolog [Paramacrobiotus metropolitanus]
MIFSFFDFFLHESVQFRILLFLNSVVWLIGIFNLLDLHAKMPKNKKKFNKKTATTYALINRNLQPIGEDEESSGTLANLSKEELLARKEEEHKVGIYFNDNYDYMRHLRDVSSYQGSLEPVENFRMGSSASDALLDVLSVVSGRSNRPKPAKLPPTLDFLTTLTPAPPSTAEPVDAPPDTDINAAMAESFAFDDPDNLLDDDFIAQADGPLHPLPGVSSAMDEDDDFPGVEEYVDPTRGISRGGMVGAWLEHQPSEEEMGEGKPERSTGALIREWVRLHGEEEMGEHPEQEETRSRLSKYSMSSSVMRRSAGLKQLDEHFEQMFSQYDEEEIGGLDLDDHEGASDNLVLRTMLTEQAKKNAPPDSNAEEEESDTESETGGVDEVALKFRYEDDAPNEMVKVVLEEDDDTYDCQSIISHRSNKSYQPKILDLPRKPKPIRINNKTGFPLPEATETLEEAESEEEEDVLSLISSLSVARPKNETPEERRMRKQALKGLRRERRVEKKGNRLAFGVERVQQERAAANVESRRKTVAVV